MLMAVSLTSVLCAVSAEVLEVTQSYDRFKDITTLEVDLGEVDVDARSENYPLKLSLHRVYRGVNRRAPDGKVVMIFKGYTALPDVHFLLDNKNRFRPEDNLRYRGSDPVRFALTDKELGVTRRPLFWTSFPGNGLRR
jgi:hypothetical protein